MNPRRTTVLAVVALAVLGCGPALAQQADPTGPSRVELWIRAGWFEPSDDTFRRVYSDARLPLAAQADWRIHRVLSLFGGLRYLRASGHAISESGTVAGNDPATATQLTITSGRFGGLVVLPAERWDVRFGGGIAVNHYSEAWPEASAVSAKGTRTGWLLQAAFARHFGNRWSAGGSVEYSGVDVPGTSGEFAVPALDLGGLDVLFGIGFRF